ncbi:MAG: hypothetical protein IJW73_06505, partial [Candidatus Gastranaerophilales bacterium]|nr:hypothetical protein [Candidatus Gastranaerophilales bacterium]
KYQPYVDKKIEKLLELKKDHAFEIYLDGAVTIERIKQWEARGVRGFVLGTATLFRQDTTYQEVTQSIFKKIFQVEIV